MKSHATRFDTHINKALENHQISAKQADTLRGIARDIVGHRDIANDLEKGFWKTIMRK